MKDLPMSAAVFDSLSDGDCQGSCRSCGDQDWRPDRQARRYLALSEEMAELESKLDDLTARANPALRGARGVGVDVAAILLVAAGDNPERMSSEAAFAALCGVSPIEASSGKVVRHRLNRSGNRQANHALWRIVMVRLTCNPATQAYVARRLAPDLHCATRSAAL